MSQISKLPSVVVLCLYYIFSIVIQFRDNKYSENVNFGNCYVIIVQVPVFKPLPSTSIQDELKKHIFVYLHVCSQNNKPAQTFLRLTVYYKHFSSLSFQESKL